MAKLGYGITSNRARQTLGYNQPAEETDALEVEKTNRRFSNVAPASTMLAEDTIQSAKDAATERLFLLEQAGLTDTEAYRNASQIAERGALDPMGKVGKVLGFLDYLDRPGHLIRTFIADVTNADKGSEISLSDYGKVFTGDYEALAQKHGGLYGEDGRLVGGELLDAWGWETEKGDTNWFNNAVHGVTGFALDVAADPLTYITGGAGGALKKTILTGANQSVEAGLTRGMYKAFGLADEATKGFAVGGARGGTERVAEEAATRLRTTLDNLLAEAGDDVSDALRNDLIAQARDKVHNELLSEVIQPLSKKRFDQLPAWFKDDTDVVGDWLKGGVRFGMGSRNVYGRSHQVLAGKPAAAREAAIGMLRNRSDTLSRGFDRLAKVKGRTLAALNTLDPVVQGAKMGYEFAPQAVRLMAMSTGDGFTAETRNLTQRATASMAKLANTMGKESSDDMAVTFQSIFRWTNSGDMIEMLDDVPERLRPVATEFAQEWRDIMGRMREIAASPEVGLLDPQQAIGNYTPTVLSREFMQLAEQTVQTGLQTWDDNAPENIKQGLAFLNEIIQGLHRRMGSDRTVAGATAYANERTLGRGVAVQEMSGSFLFHYNQVEDGVNRVATQYASHMEMNDAMMDALEYVLTKHNAQFHGDPIRRITVPKWFQEAMDDKAKARTGVLELDPAKVLQGYVNSMSQAVNERRIAHLAQQVGLLAKNEGRLDASRIAYRIHEQFGDQMSKTQRQVAKKLEKMYAAREEMSRLAERTQDPRDVRLTKVVISSDLSINVPREALDDPKIAKAIEKAKTSAKAAEKANRSWQNTVAARRQKLRNLGVSDDLAEAAATAVGTDVHAVWREIEQHQMQRVQEEFMELHALLDEIDSAADAGQIIHGRQALIDEANARVLQSQRELAEARLSFERQWKRRQDGPLRIRFDSIHDQAFLVETFRNSLGDKLAAIADRMPQKYSDELLGIAEDIRLGKWREADGMPGARERLKAWWDAERSDTSAWAKQHAATIKKQHYNRRRTIYSRWIRTMPEGSPPFTQKRYQALWDRLHEAHGATGEVPEAYRDLWEHMQVQALREAQATRDVERLTFGVVDDIGGLVNQFDQIVGFFGKLERGETIGAGNSAERRMFTKWARESGLLRTGQTIEWGRAGSPYGIVIRDMNDYALPSLRTVERKLKAMGFRSLDNARRIASIAGMTERQWYALNALMAKDWGADDNAVEAILRGTGLTREAIEQAKDDGWVELRRTWGYVTDPHIIQEWTVDGSDNLVVRWERNANEWPAEEAIALRDKNTNELFGFISSDVPRDLKANYLEPGPRTVVPTTAGAPTVLNGQIILAIDPAMRNMTINGKKAVVALRQYAELAQMPTVVGSGATTYHVAGMRSAYKNAVKEAEKMGEDVRTALLRLTDDVHAGRVTQAEVALREARRAASKVVADQSEALKIQVKWDKFSSKMSDLADEMGKKHPDIGKVRQMAAQLRRLKMDSTSDRLLDLGPRAQFEITNFLEHVDHYLGAQDLRTAWLESRVQDSMARRSAYFDPDKAKQNIEALLRTRENKQLDGSIDAWYEAMEGTEKLAERIGQILGYSNARDGSFVLYHTDEQAEGLLRMIDDARKLWNENMGEEGNPFEHIIQQAYTPVGALPGWATADAVKLGGEGITGWGGDAQAMKFLENFIGKHAALGTPRGMAEFTNVLQRTLNAWKTYATVMRLPFHTRNFISAMWANQLGDVRPQEYAGAMKLFAGGRDSFFWRLMVRGEGIEEALGRVKDPHVRAAAKAFYDEGGFFETYAEQEIARRAIKSNHRGSTVGAKAAAWGGELVGPHGALSRGGGHMMQGVESFHRFAAFLRMWESQVPGSSRTAMSWVNTIHFDYSDLTSFERDVIRKYVPFYVWAKNNIPLQLRIAVERPGIINRYGHMIREAQNAWGNDDQDMPLASWHNTPLARVGDLDGAVHDDFYSQIIWSPDIPVADLYDLGGSGPSGMLTYLLNALGPQFEVVTGADSDYKLNAPGSMQSVITALGGSVPSGLNRVNPIWRNLWSTGMPLLSDYVDPFTERDPARLERLGQSGGVEGSSLATSLGRGLTKNLLGGLGISFEGSEAAYRSATGASFQLQDDLYDLRKQGFLDAEKEESIGALWDELNEDKG